VGKIAFLFPGQGAQHVGMGRSIAEKLPAARQLFEQADELLGFSLSRLCVEGPATELDTTAVSQPAIFVTSLAALELLKAENPQAAESCAIAAGLSLGEYTALVFAGALSFADGLRVVKRRGEAMQQASDATPSGMVSVLLLDREKVESIRDRAKAAGHIEIANYLCPGNLVLSGEKAACEKAAEIAGGESGKAVPLAVAGAFHTKLMKPADERLAEALASVTIAKPRIPVISNVDAQAHEDPEAIRQNLVRQVISPVRWEDTIRSMLGQGVDQFFEIGPGRVLRGLLKRIDRKVDCQTINEAGPPGTG
jgi:[acyl-carrier-protein] S-malonyltransferase